MRSLAFAVMTVAILAAPGAADEIVDTAAPLETLETDFGLADGPAWNGKDMLYIPDVKGETLYGWNAAKGTRSVVLEKSGRISASYYRNGRLYLSDNGASQIAILKDGQKSTLVDLAPARPNDLCVDQQGGVYCTLTREGEVAYITAAGAKSVAVPKIESPNGIVLSPDEKTLYVSAYAPKQIWAYDLTAPGKASQGRMLAAMDDGDAKGADGMTADSAGNIYCAGASDVWIWSPSGKLLAKIPCPTRPINCAFGDSDLKSLYITGFGGLYRQRMKVAGRAP